MLYIIIGICLLLSIIGFMWFWLISLIKDCKKIYDELEMISAMNDILNVNVNDLKNKISELEDKDKK